MSAAPRSTRRQFLTGQAAADALTHLDVGGGGDLPSLPADRYLVRLARRAMACNFEVFLNAGQYPQGTTAGIAALDLVDELESQLTVYRETSEISKLNQTASFAPVEVEPRLFELLELAVRLHGETKGAFDVTAGRLSKIWGFTKRAGQVPNLAELEASLDCVGSQHLELDPSTNQVRFSKPGLEVNLGSIGKGYALDRCAELLVTAGVGDALLHGGSSSVLALGSHAAEAAGWLVGVRNPLRPDRRLGQFRLYNRALGTSGSGTQFFVHDGRRYGHILDPRTGWPSEGVYSATVLAPTAREADALATAFYVMGHESAGAYCQEHPEIAMLMLCPGDRAGGLEVYTSGLDETEWTLLEQA